MENKLSFYICDTTLRDGEQVAGIRYTPDQKVRIAKKLCEVGVESIDAGFAATSAEERRAIKEICDLKLDMRIMSMCRVVRSDVEAALECGVNGVIDSMQIVSFIVELEDAFEVEIVSEELEEDTLTKMKNLIDYIQGLKG